MKTSRESTFVGTLNQQRQTLGLGHNAFARHLGISHAYWHQLRTGKRRPSLRLVGRVVREWPDLGAVLAAEITTDFREGA